MRIPIRTKNMVVWIAGTIAHPLLAAVTVLTVLDAVSPQVQHMVLVIITVVFNVIALGSLTLAVTIVLRRRSSIPTDRHTTVVICICSSFGLVAAAMTLAELTVNRRDWHHDHNKPRRTVALGLCAAACLAQAIFYCTAAVCSETDGDLVEPYERHSHFLPGKREESMSLDTPTSPRALLRQDEEKVPPLQPEDNASRSIPHSPINTAPQYVLNSANADKIPITEQSFLSHSLKSSINNLDRDDAFNSWDTSNVDADTRDSVLLMPPLQTSLTKTNPGCQPGTPDSPLEVLLRGRSSSLPASSPVGLVPTSLPHSNRPGTSHSNHGRRSRRVSSMVSLSSETPIAPPVNEAHIHPLFRTDSISPPPAHTPNTTIVASPIAGQFIPPPRRAVSRTSGRGTKRATSPSPLMRSKSFVSEQSSTDETGQSHRAMTPLLPDVPDGV